MKYALIYAVIEVYFMVLHEYHQRWSDFMANLKPEFRELGGGPSYYYSAITAITYSSI